MKLAIGGKVLANEKYVLKGMGDDIEGTTDGEGMVSLDPAVANEAVSLHLPALGRTIKLKIAGMDPIEELSGARMRLQNLGLMGKKFAAGKQPYVEHDEKVVKAALVRFQKLKGLAPSGELDEDTKLALQAAHGS